MPRFTTLTALALAGCGAATQLTGAFSTPPDGLSSSISDAPAERYEPDKFPLPPAVPLGDQPRDGDGAYLLSPGLYEMTVQSFCLHAGTESGGKGEAYLPVPFKGPKAELVTKLLARAGSAEAREAGVTQQETQALIWAVLARSKLSEASPSVKATADVLLTADERKRADGDSMKVLSASVLAKLQVKLPPAVRKVMEAENALRAKFASSTASYAELEAIAAPKAADPGEAKGTWTRMPEGHLVRYFPDGYQQTRLQILVEPNTLPVARDTRRPPPFVLGFHGSSTGCSGGVASVPPPQANVAAPQNAAAQRLGLSGNDLDNSKQALATAKSPDDIDFLLHAFADKCEQSVNAANGFADGSKPPVAECTKLGTQKHLCMEMLIKNAGNPRVRSEIAYSSNPDDQAELSAQVIDADVLANAYARANCALTTAKSQGKPTKGVWIGEFRAAGGNFTLRADAVILKQGKTEPLPGNIERVYDFKFNCANLSDNQLASKYDKQIDKYEDRLGVAYPDTLRFIHASVYKAP